MKMNPTVLYHITDPANVPAILRDGLKANEDGHIFVVTHEAMAQEIARNQVFLERFSLISIDVSGVVGGVIADDVAELSAPWHRIVIQESIAPAFLKLLGELDCLAPPTESDYMKFARIGMTREQVDKQFLA